ncbi:hypothetical protein CDAR_30571 [Caerostris darwini]|uniref:Uncharacterized protein n=1 Tax=Caerostris darwini TaxID=1538125 RepID=A0AAV4U4L2_9ARAC|nr:hypothetical protein CDAR_30571 [Caerostris darwini]
MSEDIFFSLGDCLSTMVRKVKFLFPPPLSTFETGPSTAPLPFVFVEVKSGPRQRDLQMTSDYHVSASTGVSRRDGKGWREVYVR